MPFAGGQPDFLSLVNAEVEKVEGVKIMYPVQVNSVFVQLPRPVWTALQQNYFFYDWNEANNEVRWMCSFDTTEDDIHAFVAALVDTMDKSR